MSITAVTMCEQIGRFLGRNSDLVFVEPDSSDKGDIYATQLPKKTLRNTPAVSITDDTAGGNEPLDLTQRIAMTLHAEGRSNKEAIALLASLQNILFPGGRSTVLTEADLMPGVIGAPAAVGTHTVWRIIDMSRIAYPQVIIPRSPGGQAVAEMAIEINAVTHSITVTE